ncbi:MAG: 6-bladed beta-propeller [Gemmatimonadales bacterium]
MRNQGWGVLLASMVAAACGRDSLPTPQVRFTTDLVSTANIPVYSFQGTPDRAGIALDDYRFALLDRKEKRILVVDTSGAVSGQFGQPGSGPGELMDAQFLIRTDSGIAVFDGLKTSFVHFDERGKAREETPQYDAVGIPGWGVFTGMAQLSDGSWVFSVSGISEGTYQDALYHRSAGQTRLVAQTLGGPVGTLRFECGARMTGGPPIFWPRMRWSANANQVVYAATGDDRVVVWDVRTGDSTLIVGTAPSRRADEALALAITEPVNLQTLSQRCTMDSKEVLRQRGMTETMPAVRSVALAPDGTVWVALTTLPDEPSFIRIHRPTATDTLVGSAFPGVFLTSARFLAETTDTTGLTTLRVWDLRPVR